MYECAGCRVTCTTDKGLILLKKNSMHIMGKYCLPYIKVILYKRN